VNKGLHGALPCRVRGALHRGLRRQRAAVQQAYQRPALRYVGFHSKSEHSSNSLTDFLIH